MRCSYSLSKTKSGRLASKKKISGRGLNLQNVPHGVARSLFIPDDGYILIGGDQSQAEARIVAYLSEDTNMLALFKGGKSIHHENAKNLFGKDVDDDSPLYKLAKSMVHGGNYGIGPIGFSRTTGIPTAESKTLLSLYHNTYPGIRKRFHKYVESCLIATRTLYNPFGRREVFLDRIDNNTLRDAYAFIPQSTSADITKTALKRLYTKRYRILLELHDGLIIQTPIGTEKKAIQDMIDAFDVEFKIWDNIVKIPISVSIGYNWRDMKKLGSEGFNA